MVSCEQAVQLVTRAGEEPGVELGDQAGSTFLEASLLALLLPKLEPARKPEECERSHGMAVILMGFRGRSAPFQFLQRNCRRVYTGSLHTCSLRTQTYFRLSLGSAEN